MNSQSEPNTKLMNLKKSYRYKVVLIGDQAVGKSSIISRYISDEFEELHNPTVGIDFLSKCVSLPDDVTVRLQLWDTAGQERFRSLIPGYLRDCSKVLIVYDLSSKRSFENVKTWLEYAQQIKGEEVDVVVVGNKSDLGQQRQVGRDVSQHFKQQKIEYYQISAKEGTGVEQMFVGICKELVARTTESMLEDKGETRLFSRYVKKRLCC